MLSPDEPVSSRKKLKTDCTIFAAGHVYEWEQRVPLYSGIAITFRERVRMTPQIFHIHFRDPESTSVGSNEELCTGTYASSGVLASDSASCSSSIDDPAIGQSEGPLLLSSSGGNTATPDDEDSDEVQYMQWPSDAGQFADLLTAPFSREPRCGTVRVPTNKPADRDILQDYAIAWHGRAEGIRSVYTWVVISSRQILVLPRICVMQNAKHFTDHVISTWGDSGYEGELVFTTADPILSPLTLRAQPIDLVATTSMQFDLGFRVYLIDVLLGSLPRRVALLGSGHDRVRDLIERLGYSELCRLVPCILTQPAAISPRSWAGQDDVDEPHGAVLLLEYEKHVACESKHSDEMTLIHDTDDTVFVQTRRVHVRGRLDAYLGQFTRRTVAVTFWVHDQNADLVQQFPDICDVDVRREVEMQCDHLRIERNLPANSRVTVFDPAPVFISFPKPHVVVDPSNDPTVCPVLDGRTNLLSVVVPTGQPPTSVAFVFTLALPQNDCEYSSECYLYYGRRRYEHYHDIELHFGAFLRLYEWTRVESQASSTSCGSGSDACSDFTWDSEYVHAEQSYGIADLVQADVHEDVLVSLFGRREDNTATSYNAGQTSDVSESLQHRGNSEVLRGPRGDNTATPEGWDSLDDGYIFPGISLMQTGAQLGSDELA